MGWWDVLCVIALLFVALVTPFEVAFLDSVRTSSDVYDRFHTVGWLFLMNRLVDSLFTIDLVLQVGHRRRAHAQRGTSGGSARRRPPRTWPCHREVSHPAPSGVPDLTHLPVTVSAHVH